jgi:flagellar motor switch protein FliG
MVKTGDRSLEIDQFSGLRKAAILMVMIGDEASSAILRELDEDEIQAISREIARVQSLTSEQAKKMLDRLMKSLGNETLSFDALQKTDPQQLAKFIHSEHPQTIALILSHLNPSQAAGLLFSLPVELRADVALRMANLDQISPEIISKIAGVIGSKLKALGELSREAYGGVHAVAEMFNRLDSNTSKEILDNIEKEDPHLVETIRHLMFVFEDLLLLDINAVKEVLAKVDRKILTVALKGTSDQMKNHMLQAMSQRGAEMLREDMDALGPIKIKEVEAAQQQIIAVVRQLETEGVISLKGTAGEQYVL